VKIVVIKKRSSAQLDAETRYAARQSAGYRPSEKNPPAPKIKPNPLEAAKGWLGKRLIEKPSGYYLDGIPANLTTIMKAYNSMLVERGAEQIGHEGWRI
jgi:hypothetical protein